MKAMLTGFAAVILIAIGADLALDQIGFSSVERFSGEATRVSRSD
ncbi:hypothetical protein AB2B41_06325 [Marimonas sp. MJW-29]|uniref:Uncharacterized protein n=1 Tax=Sulfitobacter sediminis TaxID=3234186 RepID=A0ABV3RJQ4_9RHOB